MFVNKWGANGFWYCLWYCCLVPSLLGAARRHPEVVHLTLWAVNADASTATLQTQTNRQTDKRSFRISSWRRNCHRLGGDREILPREIKSNACVSWRTRTSIVAIGISVMNKINLAMLKLKKWKVGWSVGKCSKKDHTHIIKIATESNVMFQHLFYVVLVEILPLLLIPDGKLTHHLLWFTVLVLLGRSINQAHERKAFRLSCWLWWCCRPHHLPAERHKRHIQSSWRRPVILSLSFPKISNLLLRHAQLQLRFS